ncbi:hypothetical protein K9N50_11410 [bacterium]|nr:hypothetical protein [bacterium]
MLFNETKIILDLCGGTGSWSKPYKNAGYDVRVITLPKYNVVDYIPPESVYGILAAPPCTEFSLAIATRVKGRDIEGGMNTVNACMRIILSCNPVFWALENPKGLLNNWLGVADFTFQPWMFGDPWTKSTCLWGKFNIPELLYDRWTDVPKNKNLYVRSGRSMPSIAFMHKSSVDLIPQLSEYHPTTDAEFRAITPPGFAVAFFEANR